MSLQSVTEAIRNRVGQGSADLDAILKIDLGPDGVVVIDEAGVSNADRPADCTVKVSLADLEAIIARQLDPFEAFSLGKLTLDGDMGVAMKLGQVL